MPNVAFKIPRNVVNQHPEIGKRHWDAGEVVDLDELVEGAPANITLETYAQHGRIVVRSADAGSMIRMRRYSNFLGADAVDPGEVSSVLAKRNPKHELRIDE
jgi:hypothetical protein